MNTDSGEGGSNCRINDVSTEVVITEPIGSLRPEDIKKLVTLVLDHLRHEKGRAAERGRDTAVTDRAYRSDIE